MRPTTKPFKPQRLGLVLLGIVFASPAAVSAANTYTELESLKPQQKEALQKFKSLVAPILPHDYMREDIYLIKFLKFENFQLSKAESHLKEALKWRKDNRVDELVKKLPDDMAAFEQDYPVYVDGYDKEDRPICEIPFGAWSIRKAAAAGLTKKLALYFMVSCVEKVNVKIREQQAKGKNVTEFIFISNMDGFTVAEQACPICVPFTVNLALANDKYWPLAGTGFWTINTPDSFGTLLRLVRPVMSPPARAALKIFSANKAEWKPFLDKRVDPAEISEWYDERGKRRRV